MPSMLEHCQEVARRVGVEVPDSIIGNPDDTAQRLRGAASAAGLALLRRDWRCLTFEATISISAGTLDYALPTGPAFDHFPGPPAIFDRSVNRQIPGPVAPLTYQADKAAIASIAGLDVIASVRADPATRTPRLYLSRDPGRSAVLAFDYVTREWLDAGGGTFASAFSSDAQAPLFDPFLFELSIEWRLRKAIGRTFAQELEEADEQERVLFAREHAQILQLGGFQQVIGAVNVTDGIWPGYP